MTGTIRRVKYPRTSHLPWSKGATVDDKFVESLAPFLGREVVITEKIDGENTTIYPDGTMHARSIDARAHPSQTWARAVAATIGPELPPTFRIVGESVSAAWPHALTYPNLGQFAFLAFALYDDLTCLSWDETVEWCALLSVPTVPVLWRGEFSESWVKALHIREGTEGYVMRVAGRFEIVDHASFVAKAVRADHVPGGSPHWRYGR